MAARIQVFFRFDDYSEASPPAVEQALVRALRKHGARMTFGVVPAVTEGSYHTAGDRGVLPLGPEKIAFLREAVTAGLVDVALHGWNHRTIKGASPHSEFTGRSLDDQTAAITAGLELLSGALGAVPTVFVPPWNNYDANTLRALERCGIPCVSANRYGPSVPSSLTFLPITIDFGDLRTALDHARASGDPDPIVGVLLHPYDFEESGDCRATLTCESFEAELASLARQPDVDIVSVSTRAAAAPAVDLARFRANQPMPCESACPPFVPTTDQIPFYRSTADALNAKQHRGLALAATVALATIGGLTVGYATDSVAGAAVPSLAGVLFVGLALRSAGRARISFKAMVVLWLLGGVVASSFL
jgi:peptidoglycan/xylan/chitin deacetylase (PgdA/CDA1 family)